MGGDDFTLGENHVSAVQEGEGRMAPPRPSWLILLSSAQALAKFSPLLCPVFSPYHPKWPLPAAKLCLGPASRSREAGPAGLMGSLGLCTGKDAVPERHPPTPCEAWWVPGWPGAGSAHTLPPPSMVLLSSAYKLANKQRRYETRCHSQVLGRRRTCVR